METARLLGCFFEIEKSNPVRAGVMTFPGQRGAANAA